MVAIWDGPQAQWLVNRDFDLVEAVGNTFRLRKRPDATSSGEHLLFKISNGRSPAVGDPKEDGSRTSPFAAVFNRASTSFIVPPDQSLNRHIRGAVSLR
jgi:hypothetical protein